MGPIEVIGLALSAATTLSANAAQNKAAKAQEEAGKIRTAGQSIQDRAARRRAAREARIRKAMVLQSSISSGGQGSSGQFGASSAIQSNLGASFASQKSGQLAAEGITKQNQIAANQQTKINNLQGFSKLLGSSLNLYQEWSG